MRDREQEGERERTRERENENEGGTCVLGSYYQIGTKLADYFKQI